MNKKQTAKLFSLIEDLRDEVRLLKLSIELRSLQSPHVWASTDTTKICPSCGVDVTKQMQVCNSTACPMQVRVTCESGNNVVES
jgi:hypothetical protein